jgi:hypothetical protein
MTGSERSWLTIEKLRPLVVVVAVLVASLALGLVANNYVLAGLLALVGMVILMLQPGLGLVLLVAAALAAKFDVPTGTEVVLNPATLLVPALAGMLILAALTGRDVVLAKSRVMLPMVVFLIAGLLSLLVGNATWDPFVPRGSNIVLVQLAQWTLYAFAFVAFWLAASEGQDRRWLKWMTGTFLFVGGLLALFMTLPPAKPIANAIGTVALIRAPFWLLLTAVAGGQLLFNKKLRAWQRLSLIAIVAVAMFYSFFVSRESASNWVGVGSALAALAWLRFRRLRWVALVFVLLLLLTGLLVPTVWDFAGGEAEWTGSGQSRLVLIERVLSVSARNPVTGLGPVAYRNYAGTTPLAYGRAFWLQPQINSHNNFIDIFAQFGLLGLAIFGWMILEIGRLGYRLLGDYQEGFEAGYVRGALAAAAAALPIMVFADWILPFVYNIGFRGFQASVLFWLFLGGLAALAASARQSESGRNSGDAA